MPFCCVKQGFIFYSVKISLTVFCKMSLNSLWIKILNDFFKVNNLKEIQMKKSVKNFNAQTFSQFLFNDFFLKVINIKENQIIKNLKVIWNFFKKNNINEKQMIKSVKNIYSQTFSPFYKNIKNIFYFLFSKFSIILHSQIFKYFL